MDPSNDRHALLDDFDRSGDAAAEGFADESYSIHKPHRASSTVDHDDMPIWECIQAYRPAIFWSLIVSTCVIMEGYDTILMGTLLGQLQLSSMYLTLPRELHGIPLVCKTVRRLE